MNETELWELLSRKASAMEPELRAAFERAVARAQAIFTPKALAALLEAGDVELAVNTILAAFGEELEGYRDAVREAVQTSAKTQIARGVFGLGAAPASVRATFDILNPRVVAWLRDYELNLITQITEETRNGIRQVLLDGLRHGLNPVETARRMRPLIGLTSQQAQAVLNYRRELETRDRGALERALRDRRHDPTVARALRERATLSPQQIEDLVSKYERRWIKFRSETIAREESMRALHAGNRLTWEQVFAKGGASERDVRRFWHTAHDERTCQWCEPVPGLNPLGRAFREPFETPLGPRMGPTLHIRCRCVVFTRFV